MRRNAVLVVAWLALGVAGCSSFDREYEAARAKGAGSVEGAWVGNWESQNGHGGGRLRAVLVRSSPETVHARFRSGFWKLFESEDEVDLKVAGESPVRASGEADLGFLKGGVYRYEAVITPEKFDATYTMKFDHGVFRMSR